MIEERKKERKIKTCCEHSFSPVCSIISVLKSKNSYPFQPCSSLTGTRGEGWR